eukprot:gene8110-12571_t
MSCSKEVITIEDDFLDPYLSLKELTLCRTVKMDKNICVIAVSEKKQIMALGLEDGSIIIKQTNNFETIFNKNKHNSFICSLLFTDDGNFLFSGDRNGTIIKWNLEKKNWSHIFTKAHQNYIVTDMKIFGNYLITCGFDSFVIFWNLKNYCKITSFSYHGEQFSVMYICPIKEYLFIGTNEGTLLIIDLKDFKIVDTVKVENSGIWSIVPSPKDISLYFGTDSGYLYQYFDDGSILSSKIHDNRISEMTSFQNHIVSVSVDYTLKMTEFKSMKVILEKKQSNFHFTGLQKLENKYILTCGVNSPKLGIWSICGQFQLYFFFSKNKKADMYFYFK